MNTFNLAFLKYKQGLYIVQKGDTIKSISRAFSTTERLIIADNFLNSEVSEGDYLFIKIYDNIYEVKVEDTLFDIAKKFNVSEEEILKINKIDYIYPTQKIIIYEKQNND